MCTYVYMHMYNTYECVHARVFTHGHIHMPICMRICICPCVMCAHMYMHTMCAHYVCVHMYTNVCMHTPLGLAFAARAVCTHTYMYKRICTNEYMHSPLAIELIM